METSQQINPDQDRRLFTLVYITMERERETKTPVPTSRRVSNRHGGVEFTANGQHGRGATGQCRGHADVGAEGGGRGGGGNA